MRRLAAAAFLLLLPSCSNRGRDADLALLGTNSDQLIWEAGQKAFAKHDWETARQHYKRIVDGFTTSQYVPSARLALGDSYFQEGGTANYILAIAEYREFLNLYPSHPRGDYAQFQVGECYAKQRNGPDRDQDPTRRALDEYTRLLDLYPQTSLAEQARKRIVECRQSLARAEYIAGFFYQRTRQLCRSAIPRYETVVSEYPDYAQLDEVLFHLSECLAASGRDAEAKPQLARLIESYPKSPFVDDAQALLARLETKKAPLPSPSPSPSPTPTPKS